MKPAAYLIYIAALGTFAFASRAAVSGELTPVVAVVAAVAIFAAVTTWRLTVRIRERQRLEGMRDSALW